MSAQDADAPLDDALLHHLDRLSIQGRAESAFLIRPVPREWLDSLLTRTDTSGFAAKVGDWHRRILSLHTDAAPDKARSSRWLWANHRDLVSYRSKDVKVYVNPLLQIAGGGESYLLAANARENHSLLTNLRGASLRVSLFGKLGLYSEIIENQWLYPSNLQALTLARGVPPGGGFNKVYRERGYDFLNAKAYLTYTPAKFVRLKFGRDRAFHGYGMQSLVLSDWATDAYALQADWRFWKLRYHQRFAQMIDIFPGKPDVAGDYPRKYGVWHHLIWQPKPQFEIGVFESVVYAAQLPNGRRGFELLYLNPLIFYRAAEQSVGSPDNGQLGLTARADLFKTLRVYGQLVIDDYNFGQRKNGKYWWGNKYAWQLGFKYIDLLGVQGLDAQLEYNRVRPYMYGHFNTAAAYAHFGQPLAHPYGANFSELAGNLRWIVAKGLSLTIDAVLLEQGVDRDGLNFGADIFRSNLTHNNGSSNPDFDNRTLQGSKRRVVRAAFTASYQIGRWPAWLDLTFAYRKEEVDATHREAAPRDDVSAMLQLRWFMPTRRLAY